MAQALAGGAQVSIDGTAYLVVGSIEWSVAKTIKEELIGMDGFHGFSEKPTVGKIGFTLRDQGSLTVADLQSLTASEVTVVLNSGKTITGSNMFCKDVITVDSTEATFKVEFVGADVVEITG